MNNANDYKFVFLLCFFENFLWEDGDVGDVKMEENWFLLEENANKEMKNTFPPKFSRKVSRQNIQKIRKIIFRANISSLSENDIQIMKLF